MLKSHALHSTARAIADEVRPVERLIDESFARTAGLLALLPEVHLKANLAPSVGHEALMAILSSLNAIATARNDMIGAHQKLAEAREQLRLPETGFGSLIGCPTTSTLAVVPSAAA